MPKYIVARKNKLFWHFGIMIESGWILHFASKTNNMFAKDHAVRLDILEDFAMGRKVNYVCQISQIEKQILLKRASEYWGNHSNYSLNSNNCILFVLWCMQMDEKKNFGVVLKYYVKYVVEITKYNRECKMDLEMK